MADCCEKVKAEVQACAIVGPPVRKVQVEDIIAAKECRHLQVKGSDAAWVLYDLDSAENHRHVFGFNGGGYF